MTKGRIGMTEIYAVEMHVIGLTTGARSVSALSKNNMMKGTMSNGPFYDQPHRHHSPEGGCNPGGVKAFSHDLKRVRWPINFKPSGIEKYDGSTNPTKWHDVYQQTIEATGGDSYVMANY
jgi:hypothetical protein